MDNKSKLQSRTLTGEFFLMVLAGIFSAYLSKSFQTPVAYWPAVLGVLLVAVGLDHQKLLVFGTSLWLLYPHEYLTTDSTISFLNPTILLILVYYFKFRQAPRRAGLLLLSLTSAFMLFRCLESISVQRSLGWTFQFLVLIWLIGSTQKSNAASNFDKFFRCISWLILVLSALSLLEYLFKRPLIFNGILLPSYTEAFKWVSYSTFRIQTTLGHPLNNGLTFSTMALVFLLAWIEGKGGRLPFAVFIAASFATVISGSRTASIALVLGAALVFVLNWRKIPSISRALFLVFTPVLGLTFYLSPYFQDIQFRSQSLEGTQSQTYRLDLLNWIDYFAKNYLYAGSGPGTSGEVWAVIGNGAPLENGIMQTWVSLGLFGAITLILATFYFYLSSFQKGAWVCAIPILFYVPTTNFLESASCFLPFIGLVLIICSSNSDFQVLPDPQLEKESNLV